MDLQQLGRLLVVLAVALAIIGAVLWIGGGLGLGRLPGDLRFRGGGWSCAIPIATSIILSIVLTLLLNLILRFWNR